MDNIDTNNIKIFFLQPADKYIKEMSLLFKNKYEVQTIDSITALTDLVAIHEQSFITIISDETKNFMQITSSAYKLCQKNLVFILTNPKKLQQTTEKLKYTLDLRQEINVVANDDLENLVVLIDKTVVYITRIKVQLQSMLNAYRFENKDTSIDSNIWQQLKNLKVGVVILYATGIVAYVNSYAKRILNITRENLQHCSILEYISQEQQLELANLILQTIEKKDLEPSTCFSNKNKIINFTISSSIYKVENNDLLLFLLNDVTPFSKQIRLLTEEKEAAQKAIDAMPLQIQQIEDKLKAEKTTSLGYLSIGIAHALNNPLAGISIAITNINNRLMKKDLNNIEIAKECGCTLEQITSYINKHNIVGMHKDILDQIQRISAIIKNTLIYGSITIQRPMDYYNINIIIKNAIQMAKMEKNLNKEFLFEKIKIIEPSNNVPIMVFCNHIEIGLVLLNLLKNSAESIWRKHIKPSMQSIHIRNYTNNNRCYIEVEDNGDGVRSGDYNRIFEPFYSTNCKQAGLGLAICDSIIVHHHKGKIYPKRKANKGAVFVVELPMEKQHDSTFNQ